MVDVDSHHVIRMRQDNSKVYRLLFNCCRSVFANAETCHQNDWWFQKLICFSIGTATREFGILRLKNWYLSFQPLFRIDKTNNVFSLIFIYLIWFSNNKTLNIFWIQFCDSNCFSMLWIRLSFRSVFIGMGNSSTEWFHWPDRIVLRSPVKYWWKGNPLERCHSLKYCYFNWRQRISNHSTYVFQLFKEIIIFFIFV